MPSLQVVYAAATKCIRYTVHRSDDGPPPTLALRPGEALLVLDPADLTLKDGKPAQSFIDLVASKIGAPTASTRCVEIDPDGRVVNVYAADPDIDTPLSKVPGHTLERHERAVVGDVKIDGAILCAADEVVPVTAEESSIVAAKAAEEIR